MTFTNLGTNSATTKDWLEAMKNQSSSSCPPSHSSAELAGSFTKEDSETALKRASESSKKKK
jgi:hypothetical protein